MATNPERPQYQDIIDEAWGDQVADHVIRRYRDAAERDADLAGFSPADLAGQVIAIAPGGALPYLQAHDGAGWANLPTAQAGYASVQLDGFGWGRIIFPKPFQVIPVVQLTWQSTSTSVYLLGVASPKTTEFQFLCTAPGGGAAVNGVAKIAWLALAPGIGVAGLKGADEGDPLGGPADS
jgi:hypothetical protein